MGIKKFFNEFGCFLSPIWLPELAGKRIGIDGYVWMHKAIFSGMELAYKEDGVKYIDYFMKNINILKKHFIIPIVVFDGDKLGIKHKEEENRKFKINKIIENAMKSKQLNKIMRSKIQCISINYDLIKKLIDVLKKNNIEYIVAPYEADPQLAYLMKINYIDYVITEDTDLCAYGVKQILFKFDRDKELCQLFNTHYIIKNKFYNYNNFLNFCILSGCDFFKIKGIGPKKSKELVFKYGDKIFYKLNLINPNLCRDFCKAKYTFLNQFIYCPIDRIMKHLNNFDIIKLDKNENKIMTEISKNINISNYLTGAYKDGMTSMLISKGLLDPKYFYYK